MLINADFSRRVIVHSGDTDWIASPIAGVQRKMLDRIGDEIARATSIVKFAPGSAFARHTHGGGEELFVLQGVFQDEDGDYPAGFYLRNPPGSSHTPRSETGCVIFVKLHQFHPADRTYLKVDATSAEASEQAPGVKSAVLFRDEREAVEIKTMEPLARISIDAPGGLEVLVLGGDIVESGDTLVKGSWVRIPAGSKVDILAGADGAKLWVKSGHLNQTIGK